MEDFKSKYSEEVARIAMTNVFSTLPEDFSTFDNYSTLLEESCFVGFDHYDVGWELSEEYEHYTTEDAIAKVKQLIEIQNDLLNYVEIEEGIEL